MPITLPTSGALVLDGNIAVNDANAQFGALPSILQQGGYQEVLTIEDRNSLPLEIKSNGGPEISPDGLACGRRRLGMIVYVIGEDAAYRLVPPGFFGNNGEANPIMWNALTDADKATYLDPAATLTINQGPGNPPLTYSLNGSPDDCWVRIYPEDVDGTIPLSGEPGQILVKSPDGRPYEVEWTDWVGGSAGLTSVFARYYSSSTSYSFPGGGAETKTIAQLPTPGIKPALETFRYTNADITAWKVNYKIVFDLTTADSDPALIEAWVSDANNLPCFHPTTWSAHETLDTDAGDGRAYTITGSGIILRDQGNEPDVTPGTDTRLRVAVSTNGQGNDNIALLQVHYELEALIDSDLPQLADTSTTNAVRVKTKAVIGTATSSLVYGLSTDGPDVQPGGPDTPPGV